MHMASETLSVFAIVFYICLPINQKNKRQFNFLPLVKYLYFIFRITPTIDKEPLFDDSEKAYYLTEKEMIKVENICGKLCLIGADDDTLWNTGKYIRRMDERLKKTPHKCDYEVLVYKYGTHFVFPETLIKLLVPGFSKFVMKFIFKSAKEHADECRQTRIDIDLKLRKVMREWNNM